MILLTGATGLVGSHLLLRLLREGRTVRPLYRSEAKKEAVRRLFAFYGESDLLDRADWHIADLNNIPALEAAFEGITQVFHCAAFISFSPDDEERLRKVNIEGTANIVNLCLHFGVEKLVHISSGAALGDLPEGQTVNDETSEWNPEKLHSDYAISKYGAEMEVWRGNQEGLACAMVNPGIIIGPLADKTSGTAELFSRIENGHRFYTEGITSVVAVADVVDAVILLMDSTISGEKFALTGDNYSFRRLMEETANALGVTPPSLPVSKTLTELGWRLDWLLSLFGKRRSLSKAAAKMLHATEIMSSDKIKRELGFTFRPVQTAIQQAAEYWKLT